MNKSNITMFLVLTFLWSWILWIPLTLPYFGIFEMNETVQGLIMPAIMIGAFGPLFAAVVLSYRNGKFQGVKNYFKRCFDFKVHYKYYVLGVLLALGTTMLAYYITRASGLAELPKTLLPTDTGIPLVIVVFLYTILLFFFGGGQEEFGWRGYLQNPMQEQYGVLFGSLMIGLFWGVWHLPLWFIEGEGHQYYSFFAFLLYIMSWSVTIGIVYNISGKKMVIPWVMHTISNLSVPLFPVLFMEDIPQPGYTIWVVVNIALAATYSYWYKKRFKEINNKMTV